MSTQDTVKTTDTGNQPSHSTPEVGGCTIAGCDCPMFERTPGSDNCATTNCGHHYEHHVTSANPCTVQGCTCPKFVGEDPYCIRAGCSHGYQQHDPQ
ncbi:hypothetical protein BJV77DRAFT_1003522 [Russula vinacea]|nr:hypothetical protein BJV77DRAFT_1003522 [Russula vinacea]